MSADGEITPAGVRGAVQRLTEWAVHEAARGRSPFKAILTEDGWGERKWDED